MHLKIKLKQTTSLAGIWKIEVYISVAPVGLMFFVTYTVGYT